jgi:membrane protein
MKIKNIAEHIERLWTFITEDIWRYTPQELSRQRQKSYTALKVISLAVKRYQEDNLQRSASALTYSTFLSFIPLLAVLLSIAKGFGFREIVENQLFDYFPEQQEVLAKGLEFVDSYMQHTQDGWFLGLGLVLLLYTVYSLIGTIENTFNMIWQVSKGRSYLQRLTNYFSAFFLIPVFLVCSAGLSIASSTIMKTLVEYQVVGQVYEVVISIAPLILSVFLFTALYLFMPNTKVQFRHAFYGGIFAAVGFQVFQYLYINGQIWVSKYNAIYGSFALLPLLLLWMQLSWVICLIGAEIAYAGQNVQNYDYETDSKNISRRYLDFITLTITYLIIKRFENGEKPYTDIELSSRYKIPVRLTKRVLYLLMDLGLINEIRDEDKYPNYQPAMDINQITVGCLFAKIDQKGSENFKIDSKHRFKPEWKVLLQSRDDMLLNNKELLIKDLDCL